MIRRFRNKGTGQVWLIEHQDTIDRLIADDEFEEAAEEAPAKEKIEPEKPEEQEAAEEAPAKEKTRSRKGSS